MNAVVREPTPRRILVVLYSFRIGGSEVVGLELARQLQAGGAHVFCGAIDNEPGPLRERCAKYGIEIVDLDIPSNVFERNGLSFTLTWRLRQLRLDAVHLHHFLALNKLGIPARLAGIKRVVVTEHSVLDVDQSRAGRVRARLSWRLASAITVVHQSIKEYLCETLGIPKERVFVIPIGIDSDQYDRGDRASIRAKLRLASRVTFVFVGRLAPVKDVPGLITAFLTLQSRNVPEASLLIVGDGENRATCEDIIRAHPLGARVNMVGAQADPRPYLAAGDVFVMNSRSEGTPRALLEAMAMGLPGIGPAIGGLPDLLAGRGWLTIPGVTASLESAMETVLREPDLIAENGQNALQYVKSNFDSSRIVERYQELLIA
jgi:L-malate glycosyltransferase